MGVTMSVGCMGPLRRHDRICISVRKAKQRSMQHSSFALFIGWTAYRPHQQVNTQQAGR
jgi:hypothetical protein